MEANRHEGVLRLKPFYEFCQKQIPGIGARAPACLNNYGAIGLLRRLEDGDALLHVVDVEGRHAVAVFGGVIEKLTERDARHGASP